ncbi:MAG: DUF805 domain-containing protein [Caldisericia bacterium]|nr:DUF805 domain-containing protein [Caldisericia bacterium]
MEWYLKPWKKYVDFSGRARRKEYWTFTLINGLISGIITGITTGGIAGAANGGMSAGMTAGSVISLIFSFAILLPSLAVTVRRLHDTNRNGWLILISLIPIVGWIIVLVWMFMDSNQGENDYGPDPKAEG